MWIVKEINNKEYAFEKEPVAVSMFNSITKREEIEWCYPSYKVGEDEETDEETAFFYEEYLWDNYHTCAKVEMPNGSMEKLLGYDPEIDKVYELK